jgi:glycerophosphoryl diester phosphodiesterase
VSPSLLRGDRPPLLIGHRGLPVLAPENTLRSFELALERGNEGIEVDVVSLHDGTLVAGHSLELAELCRGAATGGAGERDLEELRRLDPELATLDEVLALARSKLGEGPLLLDLKSEGREEDLVEEVRAHGLEKQAVFCSLERRQLARLRRLAPEIVRSVSYPPDRRRVSERRPVAPFVPLAVRGFRAFTRSRAAAWIEQVGASAVTIYHELVGAGLVRACHERRVAVIAWTVNDVDVRRRLIEARIDAIITDDPRPFLSPNR